MNKPTQFLIGLLAVAALAFGIVSISQPSQPDNQNGPTLGVASGPDVYVPYFFLDSLYGADFTQGGGIFSISTTSASYTVTQADLAASSVISVASNATSAAISVTLPATSTLTTLLPKAGDFRTWQFQNLHTAAATTSTIVAGTGIDLIGVTANDDVINAGAKARLTCYRQASTDVVCQVFEFVAAD
jgi:hypothetical protein